MGIERPCLFLSVSSSLRYTNDAGVLSTFFMPTNTSSLPLGFCLSICVVRSHTRIFNENYSTRQYHLHTIFDLVNSLLFIPLFWHTRLLLLRDISGIIFSFIPLSRLPSFIQDRITRSPHRSDIERQIRYRPRSNSSSISILQAKNTTLPKSQDSHS